MSSFALSNVYNHFLTAYTPRSTRYDNHKKDELKSVYRAIVKESEDHPLFLMDRSGESQRYAINLKEDARDLKNAISSLESDFSSSVLDKKIASSSNEDLVEAKYVGSDDKIDSAPSFELEIHQLASPQINIGNFLPAEEMDLPPDDYSFDIHVNDTDYEFQFSVDNSDSNLNIQNRISRLINRSNIGVEASIIPGEGENALRIESVATGTSRGEGELNFVISDDNTSRRSGAVDYLGIGSVAHQPTNAEFLVNGMERTAYSNNFTIDKQYEITLKGVQDENSEPVQITLKPDLEALTDNINNLAGAYNDFIRRAAEYTGNYGRSHRFMYEMQSLTRNYTNDLDAIGLSMQADGTISVNEGLLTQTAREGDPKESLSAVQNFTNALLDKTGEISINPMKYTEQVMVAYKNPGKNFPNPYEPSIYSGMMFSSFC